MNDLLPLDAAEDRVRRALQVRAEDMAPYDVAAAPRPVLVPAPPSEQGRRGGRTAVLAAAALLVVAGGFASVVLARASGGPDRVTNEPAARASSVPETTGTTVVTTAPSADVAQPMAIDRLVDSAAPDARNVSLIWYRGWNVIGHVPDDATQVDVGGRTGYVGTIAPEFAEGLQLWLPFDEGIVELQAVGLSGDELVTIAAALRHTPGTDTFDLTPPPGFTSTTP